MQLGRDLSMRYYITAPANPNKRAQLHPSQALELARNASFVGARNNALYPFLSIYLKNQKIYVTITLYAI